MRGILLFLFTTLTAGVSAQRNCLSREYYSILQSHSPISSEQLEVFITNAITTREQAGTAFGESAGGLAVIRIPVVVHVLYNSASEEISDEQVNSQIKALNHDFRKLAGDPTGLPQAFRNIAADSYIEFSLALVDPQGYATTGIVRKKTNIKVFGIDDRIKQSAIGGDDPWDPDQYLNIWVGNTAGAYLGYASVVGGPKKLDGVVIRYNAFGTTGKLAAPYDKGRTAVHEIGHWLGLYHIWGDRFCGDDRVEDTPPQQAPTNGCPTGNVASLCTNDPAGKMYMNFMDLTDDACTS
ncbi:MAG TPA: zinc metalloprotease, partial [Flavitalea sp.]|nr:zinc metalloprotease [Flavitalea sp.]